MLINISDVMNLNLYKKKISHKKYFNIKQTYPT
jgi:hypothetical protein